MSKIYITELNNSPASQFNVLNEAETSQVLGGSTYSYHNGVFNFDISAYLSSEFNIDLDLKDFKPTGKNEAYKFTIGGKKYSFTSQYKTGSNAYNYSFVSL